MGVGRASPNPQLPTPAALRATACALAIQATMAQFATLAIPGVGTVAMAIKVAVASGAVRRLIAGDATIQLIDVLVGTTLDRLAEAEHYAGKGEVPLGLAWLKGLTLRLGLANVIAHVDRVLSLIEAGKLDPSPLVTHHMKLDQAPEAYAIYDQREALKIVLTP